MKNSAMQYKKNFLRTHRTTARAFELKYIQFMESNPDEQAYRAFAKRWLITIHKGLGDSKTEAVLSVNIAAIKVMADTEAEARASIENILQSIEPKQ
jgi:hypothetical protein